MQYAYKTNSNCAGCVSRIKPQLDQLEQTRAIEHWNVDLNNPDYVLTVETTSMTRKAVADLVEAAVFSVHPVAWM